jgi:hypothetical protein
MPEENDNWESDFEREITDYLNSIDKEEEHLPWGTIWHRIFPSAYTIFIILFSIYGIYKGDYFLTHWCFMVWFWSISNKKEN